MKITKEQLRQLIKEELEQLDEMTPLERMTQLYGDGDAPEPKVAAGPPFDQIMADFIKALRPLLK